MKLKLENFVSFIEMIDDQRRRISLEWPFWTKLIVVAIGFTGGLVFLYVQCKMYLQVRGIDSVKSMENVDCSSFVFVGDNSIKELSFIRLVNIVHLVRLDRTE